MDGTAAFQALPGFKYEPMPLRSLSRATQHIHPPTRSLQTARRAQRAAFGGQAPGLVVVASPLQPQRCLSDGRSWWSIEVSPVAFSPGQLSPADELWLLFIYLFINQLSLSGGWTSCGFWHENRKSTRFIHAHPQPCFGSLGID